MLALIAVMLISSCAAQKQEYKIPDPKTAVVSEENPYREKLQFPFDDKGLDLNVALSFNETDNILTLCVSGSRQLMVFRQDTYYGKVFSKSMMGQRTLDPKKLPYPVLIQPNLKITLSNNVWKSFRKKRVQHLFNNWLVGVSPELEAITPSTTTQDTPEATLIVDSIVQRFKVDPKATKASFTLRNFLVADKDGLPTLPSPIQLKREKQSAASLNYQIVYENDLNLTFNVKLQRNPCFGQDSLIALFDKRVSEIKKAYENLHEACPTGIVNSEQERGVFNQHRKFLQSQFPCMADSSACTTLQDAYNRYNAYVDSIKNAPCVYVKPQQEQGKDADGVPNIGVRASYILECAHRLDNIVSQIMVSRDAVQIHDLIDSGNSIVVIVTKAVHDKGLINAEQKSAYEVFQKARSYFRSVALRQ